MTELKNKYYVYIHREPSTQTIVYVGRGTSCRAFRATGSGHRAEDHKKWLEAFYDQGINPVEFWQGNLTKQEAGRIEATLITEHKPTFNKLGNPDYEAPSKYREFTEWFKSLRDMGYSYTHIAFLSGAPGQQSRKNKNAMTIWRAINE